MGHPYRQRHQDTEKKPASTTSDKTGVTKTTKTKTTKRSSK